LLELVDSFVRFCDPNHEITAMQSNEQNTNGNKSYCMLIKIQLRTYKFC